ncbi:hypothetical protein VP01_639g6 [Puccinia sorghi]|uniref:Uncharacterized protein n=1 Tax=Puccinia sorghi TaxID=27349 RepID=A0A0L6UFX0_9BASI|nr:hypothetical protein VP01_639g6 [Puccinia sorghi]
MSLSSDQAQPASQEPHSLMTGSQKTASATDHMGDSDLPPSSSAPAPDRESQADKSDDNPPSIRATPEPQEPKTDFISSEIRHEYFSIILKGFAVALRPSMLQSFHQDPLVKDIEMDQKVHI